VIPFLLAMASAGCSHKPSVDDLNKLKAEACACKDKDCAQKAADKLTKMLDGVSENDMDEKTMGVSLDIGMCVMKLGAKLAE